MNNLSGLDVMSPRDMVGANLGSYFSYRALLICPASSRIFLHLAGNDIVAPAYVQTPHDHHSRARCGLMSLHYREISSCPYQNHPNSSVRLATSMLHRVTVYLAAISVAGVGKMAGRHVNK